MPDPSTPALADEDYYYDGPFLVFTATYHLKRGYCCGNGCRHCPYDDEGAPETTGREAEAPRPDST